MNNRFLISIAAIWGILLEGGLIYYLLRAWRNRIVTLVGSSGCIKFARDSNPAVYWAVMIFYCSLVLLLILLCGSRIHGLLHRPDHLFSELTISVVIAQ